MKTMSLAEFPGNAGPTVVTVGNFDGVHKGHQSLIHEVTRRACRQEVSSVVVTFEPHTRTVVSPGTHVPVLTTLNEKAYIMEKLGVDYLVWIPFDRFYASMGADEFVKEALLEGLGTIEWVMGQGHCFGRDRCGGRKVLRNAVGEKHFKIFVSGLVSGGGSPISSTEIRMNILNGRMAEAIDMLGHPYAVASRREKGTGQATGLGFPTLNFRRPPEPKVVPVPGVYAAVLNFGGKGVRGILYIGECPTLGAREEHLEFHCLETPEMIPEYGDEACIWVHKFLRKDTKFADRIRLISQIKEDIEEVKRFFHQE